MLWRGIITCILHETYPHQRRLFSRRNAAAIAMFLEIHSGCTKVVYPGLKSHPQHDIATRQQNGYGAMITFYCVGGREQSGIVLKNVSDKIVYFS